MIKEFERYHGVVLRDIIVCASGPISIANADEYGRVNCYLLNSALGLYIKHSSNRLSPWQFTFHDEHRDEITHLEEIADKVWIALACGPDGVALITADELRTMNDSDEDNTWFVRVARDRGTMYHLNGSADGLGSAKPRGVRSLIIDLEDAA